MTIDRRSVEPEGSDKDIHNRFEYEVEDDKLSWSWSMTAVAASSDASEARHHAVTFVVDLSCAD